MIEISPKPLPKRRLEQLVHGLQERMGNGAERMAEELEQLNQKIVEFEEGHNQFVSDLKRLESSEYDSKLNSWDEERHRDWDRAERLAYSAVYDGAAKQAQLKADAQKALADASNEAKQRVAEIEKRFLRAKDQPIAALNTFRNENSERENEIQTVENNALAAINSRSLRVPKVDADDTELPSTTDAKSAVALTKQALDEAKHHAQRLAQNPLSKFFESAIWWAICGTVAIGAFFALWFTTGLPILVNGLISMAITIALVLMSLVAIRPLQKRSAATEYPKMKHALDRSRQLCKIALEHAIRENDEELKRLANKRDEKIQDVVVWRNKQHEELNARLKQNLRDLRRKCREQKLSAQKQLNDSIENADHSEKQEVEELRQLYREKQSAEDNKLRNLRSETEARMDDLRRGGAARLQSASQKALTAMHASNRWCAEQFVEYKLLDEEVSNWPASIDEPILPLGNIAVSEIMPEIVKAENQPSQLKTPVLYSPLTDGYLTITGDPSSKAVQSLVQQLVLRALTTLPADKLHACIIDPPGLGRDFGWLMHLGDFDPQMVTHRVWTQPAHIAKQVQEISMLAEDFIQQSLRDQFSDIKSYNAEAGALAETYRMLIWSSFPHALDDQSWKAMQSLLDTGTRCGVVPILIIDPNAEWPSPAYKEFVFRRGVHLKLNEDGSTFCQIQSPIESLPIEPPPTPDPKDVQQVVQHAGKRALLANRIEVPLRNITTTAEERWQASTAQSLEIPVGQSGIGRIQSIKLGIGTAQHAIIAGKTGSGKSSLLHAMITSAALKYSPDELRLVLLDFKKGVEFQVYSDAEIPHADIIGIESHREFGLSALEYIDGCLQRRGEEFRKAGVQDIAGWKALRPDIPMPRMLLVIDEFQELFVEDDKLSNQASLILDRIVRQGRSFGVHAVLSSQTLAGAYSLPRTTLGQMAVRVALQCDASDAQIIFAEDNPAAARLKHPGQAVYNDAGGRIEGNQPMQVGWLTKAEQVEWFGALETGYRNQDATTNLLGRSVIYDGNRSASWDKDSAILAIKTAKQTINPTAKWCVLGESVAISPAVVVPMTNQAGRNAMVVGGEDPLAASVLHTFTSSFVRASSSGQEKPEVWVIQGARPTDANVLALSEKWKQLSCNLKEADSRGADELISELHTELKRRIDDDASGPPILLSLLQLGRLRSLRAEDDFASFGESDLKPDKMLEEILRDGPSNQIFSLVWAESYSTVNRWLSRASMREIEVRLLMQMSANDSTNLIESIGASRLGETVMLAFDEATGQEQKFRPYSVETLNDLLEWSSQPTD